MAGRGPMTARYEVFGADVDAVAAFYVDVLGFEITVDRREDDDAYVRLRRGAVSVACSRHAESPGTVRRPPHGSEIVLEVPDIDGEYATVTEAGADIAEALTQQPWGLRDFRLADPTGQWLRVSE